VVVHCAARPSVDWCEHYPDEARLLNVNATEALAEACAHINARLAFLSTDYVFDGVNGPYNEDDGTNPINVYGRLKLEAEQAIRGRLNNPLIIRTTNVYGFDLQSKNFVMGILPRLARGEKVPVAADQFGNPTLVNDLCSTVKQLITVGATGTFHVVGPDYVNRVDWARAVASVFDLDPGLVVAMTTEELNQPAPRPKRAGLISNHLNSLIREPLLGYMQGLSLMKRQWDGAPPIESW
jgi:dTDP-4-dehydrorhamnose reductase